MLLLFAITKFAKWARTWKIDDWKYSINLKYALTLFRPEGGGEAIVPALTLDVYNVFHKQAKPTKPGDFS